MARARGNLRCARCIVPGASLVVLCLLLIACGAAPMPAATTTAGAATGSPVASAAARPGAPGTPGSPRITGSVTIFAAASLADAFDELKRQIEAANPDATIRYSFAASSALATQLEQGAKADLVASADQPQMDRARQAGVIQGEGRVFVQNKPVIIVPANNPRNISRPQDLANPGVKLVLAAPQVPIGNYARQVFDNMGHDPAYGADFAQRVRSNVASEEANVRQVVGKVQLGEGDAGIVYSSDVTPAVRNQLRTIQIPDDVNVIARYPVAVVKGAANEAGARAFVDYLVSPAGQAILERWGFIPLDRLGNAPVPSASASGAATVAGAVRQDP